MSLPPEYAAVADALVNSSSTLVLVDAIDLAGAAAAVELAITLRATLALSHPDDIACRQEQGLFTVSSDEAAKRCDRLVLLGTFSADARADEGLGRLLTAPGLERIVHLDTGASPDGFSGHETRAVIERVALKDAGLIDTLGALKVTLAGGNLSTAHPAAVIAREIAGAFENARYGVIAYEAGALSRYAMFAAMALADSLSKAHRWALVPVAGAPGQSELTRMSLSLTGLPPPVSFARSRPVHDHDTLHPRTLVADGDVETVVWVSASRRPRPDWLTGVTLVAVDANEAAEAAHHIPIGVAGVDYGAILEPGEVSGFVSIAPDAGASTKRSAAEALIDLAAAVDARTSRDPAEKRYDRTAGVGA